MTADVFLDTNVLVYSYDDREPNKRRIARSHIAQSDFCVSTQVLGELFVTLTRKIPNTVPAEAAAQAIEDLRAQSVVPLSDVLVSAAIETSIRYQLSYWDALIVEAAAAAGCTTLLTEDLNDGTVIKGVHIVNPFGA